MESTTSNSETHFTVRLTFDDPMTDAKIDFSCGDERKIQQDLDNLTQETAPKTPFDGVSVRSSSIQQMISTLPIAHKARLVIQITEQFGRVGAVQVDPIVALLVVVIGNCGMTFVEGLVDQFPQPVLAFLGSCRTQALNGNSRQMSVNGETPWALKFDPLRPRTLDAAGHIAAFTARALLLRSSFDNISAEFEDSLSRANYTVGLRESAMRFFRMVAASRIRAGMRAMNMRGEFILTLSYSSALGRNTFRRRINRLYREDVAEQYNKRLRTPLMTDIAGALVVGETPRIYAGLVHLIRPVRRD
jgi:hypothetical protein